MKLNGLDIKNIQLTCKNGITTLLADVLNNTNKDSRMKNINIKLLDENNKEGAERLLIELGKKHQIIYFTCSQGLA